MAGKYSNQEEQLRALTEDFSLDIDTSELWEKVEAQLPPVQKERSRSGFWWFAAGVAVAIIGVYAWNYNSPKKQDLAITGITKNAPTATKITTDTHLKHTDNSPLSITSNEPSINLVNTKLQPTIEPRPFQSAIESKIKKVNFPEIFHSDRYDEKSASWKEIVINQSPTDRISIGASMNPSAISINEEIPEDRIQNRAIVPAVLLKSNSLTSIKKEQNYDFSKMEIKPLEITHWLPYYAFSSGVNMHQSKIFSASKEGIDLTQFDNEKPLLGLSSALSFGFENSNGWRFGLGLSHSRLVNRFSQNESIAITGDIIGNEYSKIDEEGNITHIGGTITQTLVTNYDLEWHRTHDFVNAQLNIGKRIFKKGKFAFYTDGIISKGLWSRHSGYYYSEGNNTINKFSAGEDNPYINGEFDAGLSIGLEYKINKISFSLSPYARVGLNSITQNSNYYQLKNSQYGVQLGVVYRP